MIVPNNPSWLGTIFTIRGSTIAKTWRRLLLVTATAAIVTWVHNDYGLFHTNLTTTPFSLIGIALGIFLGFRNTTSYERFWEGRKLWGGVVNASRNFARQVLTLLGESQLPSQERYIVQDGQGSEELRAAQEKLIRQVIAYVHALRQHLRGQVDESEIAGYLDQDELRCLRTEQNRPVAIAQMMSSGLRRLYDRRWIHPQHLPLLDTTIGALIDLQGGCERIKATPIPFSYNILLHRIVFVYCFTLPFGLVDMPGLGAYTPVVVLMVSYAFFGLDAVGDEIENPFGLDANDLPLSAITKTIEINLLQRIGNVPLPPAPAAVGQVLS